MSGVAVIPRIEPLDLEGAGLLVPELQSEPLPVRAIRPAPCTQACPAGINVKAYVSLIAERRFSEALEVIRRRCPLPGICGRVCHHPCEVACKRGQADEPIAIRALKRVVADHERDFPKPAPPPGPARGPRVAVIGSGPAGLTAAYDLRLAGFPVTVFEADTEPGGMLRYGITAYRLPRDVLDAEIEVLVRAGVEIETGRRLGKDLELEALTRDGFGAVLLAVGAQVGRKLGVPGEEGAEGVEDALEFLRRTNGGDRTPPGRRVVVIGGGSTAVEAARMSLRLGARKVDILYRRYREELLAGKGEIEVAEQEGIDFNFLVAPLRVMSEGGRVTGLQCAKVGLGEPDASGRRRPIVIPGSEFVVECDRILAAVGQEADMDFMEPAARERIVARGKIRVDDRTTMTTLDGVFAAGDVVTGPATVIEAIGAAHRAAESIRHYLLEGAPAILEERPERTAAREYELSDMPPIRATRVRAPIELPQPGREFGEVELGYNLDDAVAEARRCLRCGPCGDCQICAPSCHRRHIMVQVDDGGTGSGRTALVRAPGTLAMSLDQARITPGWMMPQVRPGTLHEFDTAESDAIGLRPMRVQIERELCRGCGRCVEVCPFDAIALSDPSNGTMLAKVEPALCRGCNLCTSVCPTKATRPTALSPQWWGSRLKDAFPEGADSGVHVVLACQRRAGSLERPIRKAGVHVEIIRFRCIGQVDAGMLLELRRLGAEKVLIAGCSTERCRFGSGAELAAEEMERGRSILKLLGTDDGFITWDASDRRAHDQLDRAVAGLVRKKAARKADRPGAPETKEAGDASVTR